MLAVAILAIVAGGIVMLIIKGREPYDPTGFHE